MPTTADKTRTFENIARLRRAERETPENRDIPLVRAALEQELGETVSQRLAAKLLGISHTGLRRWVTSGDIPIVYNRRGKEGIPVSALLDLCEEVEGQRRSGRAPRRRAGNGRRARPRTRHPSLPEDSDRRRAADLRSLAYHGAVAQRLRRPMIDDARHRIWVWQEQGKIAPRYAGQWEEVLSGPLGDVRKVIAEDSERGRDLRQNSPFAGVLSEAERRAALGRPEG